MTSVRDFWSCEVGVALRWIGEPDYVMSTEFEPDQRVAYQELVFTV